MSLFPSSKRLYDRIAYSERFPLRARFIRPATTGRTDRGALSTEETKGDGATLHQDVHCAISYGVRRVGERAGPALTQSRTQGVLVCNQKLKDVRETDQIIVTDPDIAGDTGIRFHIRNVSPRMRLDISGFAIERV